MEVLVGGKPVDLPPSRKTRALLAYVALSPRRQRRERLCEIFWDVPDDPRGSLRWSLSKIRQFINVAGQTRLGADRNSVWLEQSGLVIDRNELARAAEQGFDTLSTEALEALAETVRGAFLEDISLPRCPAYEAWRTAESLMVESQAARLLWNLLDRLADQPMRALRHAARLSAVAGDDPRLVAAISALERTAKAQASVVPPASTADTSVSTPAVRPPIDRPPIDRPSIAVLPLDNMSGDPEQEYFSDGVTEDIITELSRFRGLHVLARNSSFTFKKQAVKASEVGTMLGADYMVEGSVRKVGNQVRITAQLIDTRHGHHLWAERYDRELDNIFGVQEEIARTIAAAIEPALGHAERSRSQRKGPESLSAWDWYQRGMSLMYQDTAETNVEALTHFQRAVALDPEFAAAHAAAARVLVNDLINGFTSVSMETIRRAVTQARRAIVIDDRDALAHMVLGMLHLLRGNHDEAIAELETSIGLNPSYAEAHHALGFTLVFSGRPEDAIAEFDAAISLSPYDIRASSFFEMRAWALLVCGRDEEALMSARASVRRPHAQHWAYATLCVALARLGRLEEIAPCKEELQRRMPGFSARFVREYVFYNKVPAHLEVYIQGLLDAGLPEE
jgi:TolB-like protein/DNA-binding SARP family transcriptional activator/Flp pilus assembly protein TadD